MAPLLDEEGLPFSMMPSGNGSASEQQHEGSNNSSTVLMSSTGGDGEGGDRTAKVQKKRKGADGTAGAQRKRKDRSGDWTVEQTVRLWWNKL